MIEGGIAGDLNRAIEQGARAGWLRPSEAIPPWLARREENMRQSGTGATLEPGMWVRHPGQPGWGPGQVQSVDGHRVTVNFEQAGKVLVNTAVVELAPIDDPDAPLREEGGSTT
jgi:hypothetical protein